MSRFSMLDLNFFVASISPSHLEKIFYTFAMKLIKASALIASLQCFQNKAFNIYALIFVYIRFKR